MTTIDQHGNTMAREGMDRCACGAKYWEHDVCVSCGAEYVRWATEREEAEACQRGTPGCSVDHLPGTEWNCEAW